jgi:uncharacterized protein YecT (DUF1311 family)
MSRAVLFLAAFLSTGVWADECPGGSISIEGCRKLLAPLERRLAAAEKEAEKKLSAHLLAANGPDYVTAAVKALRDSNRAWRELRNKECWYEALKDGMSMSPDYASPVAEACKVERTRARIRWMSR